MRVYRWWFTGLVLWCLGLGFILFRPLRPTCVNSLNEQVWETTITEAKLWSPPLLPVHVIIHTVVLGMWELVLTDMLVSLDRTGLLQLATSVTVCTSGNDTHIGQLQSMLKDLGRRFGKVAIHKTASANSTNLWEFSTINYAINFSKYLEAEHKRSHILYIHTKGLHADTGGFVGKWFWRQWMQDHVIMHHYEARSLLQWGYDAVGCNAINKFTPLRYEMKVNPDHAWHYSGNFWWATSSHLASLQQLPTDHYINVFERCKAENIVLSKLPKMCAGNFAKSRRYHMYFSGDIPRNPGERSGKLVRPN